MSAKVNNDQNFWSRRRAAVQAEASAEEAARDAAVLAEKQAAFDAQTDEEVLAQLELPDPDNLQEGDDFSAFMAKAVPDRIRRRALRSLWRSNPVLANVDGLVDYGEDFTDSAMVVENMQTAYQVGKGMLKHVQEMARKAAEVDTAPEQEAEEDAPEELVADATPAEVEEADLAEVNGVDVEVDDLEVATIAPAPRRMTFRSEQNA